MIVLHAALYVSLFLLAPRVDEPDGKVIPAEEARKHIGERHTVEMVVRSSNDEKPRKVVYLDSEEDFRNEYNVAIVIAYQHLDEFRSAGIDDPAAFYKSKRIRVTGTVIFDEDEKQVQIRVESPCHIKVVPDPSGS